MSTRIKEEVRARVIALALAGVSSKEIHSRTKVPVPTIGHILRKNGTPIARRKAKVIIGICKHCGKELSKYKQRDKKYCSARCFGDSVKRKHLKKWIDNPVGSPESIPTPLRNHLLETHKHKCSICGWGEINKWTGKVPLEVNHIDGDTSNNRLKNLEVLCPNCHALTPTSGILNKGNSKRTYFKRLKGK